MFRSIAFTSYMYLPCISSAPSCYCSLVRCSSNNFLSEKEQRGLTVSPEQADHFSDEQKLWENNHHKYITCLMREKVGGDFPNNLSELLAHVQKYHKTGSIISRFLLCAQEDGILYDFYKTFIEIL